MARSTQVFLDRAPDEIVTTRLLDAPPLFRVIVTLEEVAGERTLLTLCHLSPSAEARDESICTVGSVQGAIDTTERPAAHLQALPGERDFVLRREFDAPRERRWRAWIDAERLRCWWGPSAFTNTVCESDPRVGGRHRITRSGAFPGPGISHYPVQGEYLELVEPERIVATIDCAGHPAW
jgi:hypothetical protein